MNHISGGQNLELIDRTSDGKIKRQILTSVDMAPLTDIENQLKSTFFFVISQPKNFSPTKITCPNSQIFAI